MDCYFDRDYFTDYFDICSGVSGGGGGGIGPSRADVRQAKKWLEEGESVRLRIHESLEGVSDYVTAFPVERQVAAEVEPLGPLTLQVFESLPAVTSNSSLSISWAAAIKRDDEELILFL
jgi:hypothetical protein